MACPNSVVDRREIFPQQGRRQESNEASGIQGEDLAKTSGTRLPTLDKKIHGRSLLAQSR